MAYFGGRTARNTGNVVLQLTCPFSHAQRNGAHTHYLTCTLHTRAFGLLYYVLLGPLYGRPTGKYMTYVYTSARVCVWVDFLCVCELFKCVRASGRVASFFAVVLPFDGGGPACPYLIPQTLTSIGTYSSLAAADSVKGSPLSKDVYYILYTAFSFRYIVRRFYLFIFFILPFSQSDCHSSVREVPQLLVIRTVAVPIART